MMHETSTVTWTTRFRRWSALGALALGAGISAGITAEVLALRALSRLVQSNRVTLSTSTSTSRAGLVTEEMLAALPAPVRRYLTYTGIVGKPFPRAVQLSQRGTMRLSADLPWVTLAAKETYSVRPPGFVWDGTVYVGAFPIARARDMYLHGHGHMLIKAAALFPVVDATGAEMDQAAMTRYLSEMIWFPAAFLEDNIAFEAVDDRSARVTLSDHGRSATGTLYIDEEGKLTDFVSQRHRWVNGRSELTPWCMPVTAYGEFEGLRLPVRGPAVYKLPEADFEYIDVTVTQLAYEVGIGEPVAAAAVERSAS